MKNIRLLIRNKRMSFLAQRPNGTSFIRRVGPMCGAVPLTLRSQGGRNGYGKQDERTWPVPVQ